MAEADPARLALDEDVRPLLARLLSDRGWQTVAVVDVGRGGRSDEEQFAWAASDRRVLVTHNVADFAALAAAWNSDGRAHAGLILARQAPFGWLLREVLLSDRPQESRWRNQVAWTRAATRRR